MTINELRGSLAFMVTNNKQGVIDALKSLGYNAPTDGADLVEFLMGIYSKSGTAGLEQVYSRVPIVQANTNANELAAVYQLATGKIVDTNSAKFGWKDFQDLFSGSTVTTGASSSTTSKPAVSPTVAASVLIVVVVIIAVLIWKS